MTTAARLLPHSWSPTGEILAFWTWTAQEVRTDYLYPPGRLFFYDGTTGQVCSSPVPVTYPYFANTLAWMPDGKALLLSAQNQLIELQPCRGPLPETVRDLPEPTSSIQIAPHPRLLLRTAAGTLTGVEVPAPETTLILSGNTSDYLYSRETHNLRRLDGRLVAGSFSPDGAYLAVSDDTSTRVIHLTTGKVEAEATWHAQPAEGAPGPDLWLSNREVLIAAPVIGGPLILMPGKGVVRVAPEYLGLDCSNRVCRALGARSADTYHLLVQAPGREGRDVWYLYHAESGQAENLGPLTDPRFSPNGEWLAALQDLNGREASAAWVRSTDPPGGEPLVFAPVRPHGFLAWSPDSRRLALQLLEDGVAVLELAREWRWVGRWRTAGYEPVAAL
ncbi:TolB family protein [Thermoflexus hugenholtzii]